MSKIKNDGLIQSDTGCYTHMTTVCVKGLSKYSCCGEETMQERL